VPVPATRNDHPGEIRPNRANPATVAGALKHKRTGQWRPFSARILTIHFDPAGRAGSRQVATVRTNRTCSYSRQFTATRSGTWTVKFGGNSAYQPDRAADAGWGCDSYS
jgi:hypothetical protein